MFKRKLKGCYLCICCASARLPAFLSTTPHIPSSLEGTRSRKALNGYHSLNVANDLGRNRDSHCWVCLSQSEAFPPLSLGHSDVACEHDVTLHIKGECVHMLEALGTGHLVSILEAESPVVDWIVGLSQDLAATSNSKNAFYSFICLACSGRYSLCTATTSLVEEIVV